VEEVLGLGWVAVRARSGFLAEAEGFRWMRRQGAARAGVDYVPVLRQLRGHS
jgi:hypothetical protein